MSANFYLTTTLPYVNATPHLGFGWEILTADFICRFHALQGERVIFNTGTDEHGQKIYDKAIELELDPQTYTDQMAVAFRDLGQLLNLSVTNFIRTTDVKHIVAAQEIWRRCLAHGDIYKKKYQVKYCVGCELEKTDSELVDGKCPLHPNQPLELREEDNYFFRFSKYADQLLAHYHAHPDFVIGKGKMSELESFVKRGLQDFSISRLKSKMPWGISVPDDDEQVMYVWFDALTSYISTLDWPETSGAWQKFWPGMQICGKDNLRQQAAMWQAMLLAAGLPMSKQILVNGFITIDGQKMSKSVGNVIAPADLVERYGREGARFVIANFPVFSDDVDLSWSRLDECYTTHLANGLGNLASRLAKLATDANVDGNQLAVPAKFSVPFAQALSDYQTSEGIALIRNAISEVDQKLSQQKPWLIKDQVEKTKVLLPLLQDLLQIAYDLQIFLPETCSKLIAHFTRGQLTPLTPLFPRLAK